LRAPHSEITEGADAAFYRAVSRRAGRLSNDPRPHIMVWVEHTAGNQLQFAEAPVYVRDLTQIDSIPRKQLLKSATIIQTCTAGTTWQHTYARRRIAASAAA
jgi:hypothetical protein